MVSEEKTLQLDGTQWQRINMRKVAHLAAAEMIHNLYDRYWPQINSIRFRHTITNYKNGIVESYAPKEEWHNLQKWISERFLAMDPILLREIEAILNPTYSLTNEICARIDNTDLSSVSNTQLALLTIDIMDFPLGEIYKLNVVQVEYGLNFALQRILNDYEPNEAERNQLLSQLISPNDLTVAQIEEISFDELLFWARNNKLNDARNSEVQQRIKQHHALFAGQHCAYGEEPPTISFYEDKFKSQILTKSLITKEEAHKEVLTKYNTSQEILNGLDDKKLKTLCNLMSRIGVFRDANKAKLGETVPRRMKLFDEIAKRSNIPREDLDLYLISEMIELLDSDKKLPTKKLNERRKGVSFTRSDHLANGPLLKIATVSSDKKVTKLVGICASPGQLKGTVRCISTKEDIAKMQRGDIMVAIGTDFDLLEIMHLSAGIITEEGGLLSHASVVSRELGKPCLIGTTGALNTLHDGDKIYLNATAGYLELL